MTGYVVVFERDDQAGYSAYSPELPGVVAAGDTRQGPRDGTRSILVEEGALYGPRRPREGPSGWTPVCGARDAESRRNAADLGDLGRPGW